MIKVIHEKVDRRYYNERLDIIFYFLLNNLNYCKNRISI